MTNRLRAAVTEHGLFDPSDQVFRAEIMQTIVQYLQDEGYTGSSMVLQDESNVKMKTATHKRAQFRRMRRAILDGDWPEVEKLLLKNTFKNMKTFRYAVYRQQYLELIDAHENDKAFLILMQHLKELESCANYTDEFRDLCYLLSCKSVTEARSFQGWDGVQPARAALVEQYARWLDFDVFQREARATLHDRVRVPELPPRRLVTLLQQAVAFQIGSARHSARAAPRIGSILEDFEPVMVPSGARRLLRGHAANVKALAFAGADGGALATASSDSTVRIWDAGTARCAAVLGAHRSRVWDVAATEHAGLLASADGDGVVCLWTLSDFLAERSWESPSATAGADAYRPREEVGGRAPDGAVTGLLPRRTLPAQAGDVYSVRFHPRRDLLAAAGYDKQLRLYDVETGACVRTLHGHSSSVSSIAFNARGNLVITGSKDCTVRYWDIISGLCVKTIEGPLREVTSVETNTAGTLLLTGSKNNSNRLFDMRSSKPVRRFKGHQNTSKNFIRSAFGPREAQIIGGSEDGFMYIWDVDSSEVVSKLGPARGPVYCARWNARQNILATCSHDSDATIWHYDPELKGQP